MSIVFPASLDALTNPTSGNNLNSPSHSGQHADANDAIEALETKVGADSSAVTTSHDYKITKLEAVVNNASASAPASLDLAEDTDNGTNKITITAPSAVASDKVITLPDATDTLVGKDTTDTLTNKTLSTGSKVDANADPNITHYGMARQAIINGNFDVWQRGTSAILGDLAKTFQSDRWYDYTAKDGGTLPTLTRSRQLLTSGDMANAFYFSRVNTNGAGTSLGVNSEASMYQQIENGVRNLCGLNKKVTVSFWARSDIANKRICPTLIQHYGTGGSPSATEYILGTPITLTSTWTKYTATITTNTLVGKTFGTGADDRLILSLWYMWGTTIGNSRVQTSVTAETYVGSGNIDIAQVQLCSGDVALPFQPKSYGEELRACQRYYEKSFNYSVAPAQNTGATDGLVYWRQVLAGATAIMQYVRYQAPKRISVTPTLYNPSAANAQVRSIDAVADCTSSAATAADGDASFIISATAPAGAVANGSNAVHWTADAEL